MLINQANLTDLFRSFRTVYDQAMQGAPTVSDDFVLEQPSMSIDEKYAWLGAVPGMSLLTDEPAIQNLSASDFVVTNQEYVDTVAVKRFVIETDQYGVYKPAFAAMGDAAAFDKDIQVFNALLAGFTAADYTGTPYFYSGKIRTPGDAGFTNILVTGGNQYANAPLSIYSFRAARANLMSRVNAKGRPMNLGRNLKLVCGAGLEPIARQILIADTIIQANAGNTSVAAVTNIDKGMAQIVTSALIDNSYTPDAWFLLETGLSVKPMVFQVNLKPILIAQIAEDTDSNFLRKEFRYQAYGRYAASYLLSDLAFGSKGTGTAMTAYP